MKLTEWLIWSVTHKAWWGPEHVGYTGQKQMAGRYTLDQAVQIVRSANISMGNIPNETMVPDE